MNNLTKQIVIKVASQNMAAAKDPRSYRFQNMILTEYGHLMISEYGVYFKLRSEHLLRLIAPDYFDADGYPNRIADAYDIDYKLSHRCMTILDRKIERDPDLQLTEWDPEIATKIATPQMKLI